jgi:hypothetical protein
LTGERQLCQIEKSLFNLIDDPLEQKYIIAAHPEIAKNLEQAANSNDQQFPPPIK